MKYLPSGVQWPQHSLDGLFQPGNNGRMLLPSARASQIALVLLTRSDTVNLRRAPSGETVMSATEFDAVAIFPGLAPPCSAIKRSFPFPNTSFPSGAQTTKWAVNSPRRRGDPAGTGIDQKGPSPGPACRSRSSDRSGDTSATTGFSMGTSTGAVSPPAVET